MRLRPWHVLFCWCWHADVFTHSAKSKLWRLLCVPIFLNSSVNLDGEQRRGNINPGLSCVRLDTPWRKTFSPFTHINTHTHAWHVPTSMSFVQFLFQRAFLLLAWSCLSHLDYTKDWALPHILKSCNWSHWNIPSFVEHVFSLVISHSAVAYI